MDGIQAMLALRRDALAAGAQPLGWKTGFGSAAAMQQLGTTAPLVGFMTDRSLVEPGSEVSLDGWANPVLEPEVALYLDADGRIAEIGLALELADLDPPPDDPAAILARNIYHRGVVLGRDRYPNGSDVEVPLRRKHPASDVEVPVRHNHPASDVQVPVRHLRARIFRDGEEVASTDDVAALNGSPADAARVVVETVGDELRAGDVVIAGSVVPPFSVRPGERYRYELEPVGWLEIAFSSASSVSS